MKHLLRLSIILALALSLIAPARAAGISATDAVWQINSSADTPVGADTNGGVWDAGNQGATGTDHSQIATTAFTVTTTGSTTVTATAGSFNNTMLGNGINIASDNIYIIVGYTNSTTVTVDRATGTAVGSSAKVGGPLATLAAIYPATNVGASGNTVYWHAGTYTLASTQTVNLSGAINSVINVVGYSTNRTLTNTDVGPTVTTATNSTNLFSFKGTYFSWRNINFTNTAGTHAECFNANGNIGNGTPGRWVNCNFNGTFTKIFDLTGVNSYTLQFDGCNLTSWSTKGIDASRGVSIYIYGTSFTGGTGDALFGGTAGGVTLWCNRAVFANITSGFGVNVASPMTLGISYILNSIFYKCASGGITATSASTVISTAAILVNNIFYGNGTYAISSADTTIGSPYFQNSNAFGSNTTANYNNFPSSVSDIALSADPFVAGTSGNFALNSTAGGGVLLQALGWPTATAGSNSFPDIGAIQGTSIQTGGGGHVIGGEILQPEDLWAWELLLDSDRQRKVA